MTIASEDLLRWARPRLRDLPWRRTRDPWAVLVAEIMLQQTQVERVVPLHQAFLDRWPDPASCAEAPPGDVVRAWKGLGYNRRALNLHRAAGVLVDRHGGRVPADLGALLDLPGIGPYTARAVLAFAFEHDVGVVDTNVGRVLARHGGDSIRRPADAQDRADALVPADHGWLWNQAMLDLGATCCRARNPTCDQCPVASGCSWRDRGNPDPDPAVGSAGVSGGQSRFEGSDRQGRGRLIDALRSGEIACTDAPAIVGWSDQARVDRVVRSLMNDGLVTERHGRLSLPAD